MFTIRECELKDVMEWIELNRTFIKEEIQDEVLWEGADASTDTFAKTFAGALSSRELIRLLLFEEDGVPVGFANLMIVFSVWSHGKAMILDDLYISRTYRGSGYGKKALAYIEEYAKQEGCRRLQFLSEKTNPGAGAFYEAVGYLPADMNFYVKYL